MTKLIYHSPSDPKNISPFDATVLRIAQNDKVKIVSPYVGISYLTRLIDVCQEWRLISDVEAWLASLSRPERHKAWEFIQSNISLIHHYPAIHAKTVIGTTQAYLGSSNLTNTGILNRTEMGVMVDSTELVGELNAWFDEIWSLSAHPCIEQGVAYVQWLDQQSATAYKEEPSFSSEAIQIRSRLAPRVNHFTKVSTFAPSTAKAVLSTTLSRVLRHVPVSKLDEYIYRLILVFDFEQARQLPESAHLQERTGLSEEEQVTALKALLDMQIILCVSHAGDNIPLFRLNEDFEWDMAWNAFQKTINLWERKINRLGRKVELPSEMVVIPDAEINPLSTTSRPQHEDPVVADLDAAPDDELIEITPGEDHTYSSNIAFADAVYAELCKKMEVNGGMLHLPSMPPYIWWLAERNPLAYDFAVDEKLKSCPELTISLALDGRIEGVPCPFRISLIAEAEILEIIKSRSPTSRKHAVNTKNSQRDFNISLPQFPIHVTLREPIDPGIYPETAKAAASAMLMSLGPNQPILTKRQTDFLNQRLAKFFEMASGRLPSRIFDSNNVSLLQADKIYEQFIEMRSYWGRNPPIHEADVIFKMVADKSDSKPDQVANVLWRRVSNIPKVFYLDVGVIQKGMIFVFLNNLLVESDWEKLPLATAALAKAGADAYLKLT